MIGVGVNDEVSSSDKGVAFTSSACVAAVYWKWPVLSKKISGKFGVMPMSVRSCRLSKRSRCSRRFLREIFDLEAERPPSSRRPRRALEIMMCLSNADASVDEKDRDRS